VQGRREKRFVFLLVVPFACMGLDRVAAQSSAPAITMRPSRVECHMEALPDRYRERNIDINYREAKGRSLPIGHTQRLDKSQNVGVEGL
jgi:hypothetical protein